MKRRNFKPRITQITRIGKSNPIPIRVIGVIRGVLMFACLVPVALTKDGRSNKQPCWVVVAVVRKQEGRRE
jgi:hypothetical protein